MASTQQRARDGFATPLIAKLETRGPLSDEDREALRGLYADCRLVGARRHLIREGDRPDHIHLMIEGWAARYKLLPDGSRQITAFLIPGDFSDLHVTILGEMDHGVTTLTRSKVAFIPRQRMDALAERPSLVKAFWWATLVDASVLRSWVVNVGRRDAAEAIGHLFCELYVRMKNVGLVSGRRFELPLTQEEIGDALGITSVHVNRVLQRMRADGLVSFRQGVLTILDYARLEQASGFNANYLHIDRRTEGPTSIVD